MRALLLAVVLVASAPLAAQAQTLVNQQPPVPPAVAETITTIQQQMCTPASTVPPTEAVTPTAGSSSTCRRADAIPPRISRTIAFTTGADGTAVITWPVMMAVPLVFPIPNVAAGATQVPACYPVTGTATTTGVTIKCFQTQTLLGLGLVPFVSASAGVTGQVLALPPS